MFRRALPFFALALLVWAWAPAVSGQESIESQLLGLINSGRRGAQLTAHAGLKVVGRQHSQEMSSAGGLNHNGAQGRMDTAPPDPAEPNGPPDDGFTGTWCENVAYVRGAPENEVAQRIYQGWVDSSSHNRCMNDARMTVAGIGIYFDGQETYWATFESAVDQTLPGSAPVTPTPSPTPEPNSTPTLTEPEPTDRPTPTPRAEPTERPTPTARPIFGGTSPSPDIAEIVDGALDAVPRPVVRGVASTDTFVAAPAIPVGSENPPFSRIGLASTVAVLFLVADLMRRLSKRRREAP